MKKHLRFSILSTSLYVLVCLSGILSLSNCQKQDPISDCDIDPILLNSPELAEYIVAGVEYRHALGILQAEMEKADLLHLETKIGPNGEKYECLPISVDIEAAYQNFLEKRQMLSQKHPDFMALSQYEKAAYFKTCIKNSVDVNQRLLDMGVDVNLPKTKGGTTEYFGDMDGLTDYLNIQMSSSDYKEIAIVVYKNGNITTYIDDSNTANAYSIDLSYTTSASGQRTYYYPVYHHNPDNEVAYLAHTQQSGHTPSKLDMEQAAKWTGLTMKIYSNGTFRKFDENGLVD